MNRWTDFWVGFSIALLLHSLLVLGVIWLWTLRPPEFRPMFQDGDISLAVTFVAEEGDGRQTTDDGRQTEEDARRQTPDDGSKRTTEAAAEPLPEEGEDQDMLDAETAAPVSAQASANALRQGVSGAVRRKSEIRPYYPLGACLRGEEGAVTVRVWVKPSGRVNRSEVIRSSGFPALDEAAVDAARRARYVSTQPGAWRAEAETVLTFRFRLTE